MRDASGFVPLAFWRHSGCSTDYLSVVTRDRKLQNTKTSQPINATPDVKERHAQLPRQSEWDILGL
jgi:hypothetical protein